MSRVLRIIIIPYQNENPNMECFKALKISPGFFYMSQNVSTCD